MATGDPLLDFAVSLRGGLLTPVMQGISEANSEFAYLVLVPLVYWVFSRRIGIMLVVADAAGVFASVFLKETLSTARPPDAGETAWLGRAEGYGLPSGHTTAAATNWATLAAALKSRRAAVLGVAVVAAVAFSRLYLGVHYSVDVAGGALLGAGVGACALAFGPRLEGRIAARPRPQRYALVFAFPALLLLNSSAGAIVVLLAAAGACWGHLVAGERQWILPTGDPRKLPLFGVLRLAIGLPVLGALALGLGAPAGSDPLTLALRFLALGFFMTCIGPKLFLLAEARLGPPVSKEAPRVT